MISPTRFIRPLLVIGIAAWLLSASPRASAVITQQSKSNIRLSNRTQESNLRVRYEFQLFEDNGSPITDAEMTVTYVEDDGKEAKPSKLISGGDGYYRGSLSFPRAGTFVVRAKVAAGGSIEMPQDVELTSDRKANSSTKSPGSGGRANWSLPTALAALLVVGGVAIATLRRHHRNRSSHPT